MIYNNPTAGLCRSQTAKMMNTYRFLTEKFSWSEDLASISSVRFVGLLPARFKPPTPRFLMTKGDVQTSETHLMYKHLYT